MSQHARVWVAGRDCTADTIAELTIKGGRADFLDAPDAVTLSLSIEWPAWASVPVLGDPVQVAGWLPGMEDQTRRALFAGHVTDVALEAGVLSLLAVDPSRRLDGISIGDTPWPVEAWAARVQRILDLGAAQLGGDTPWLGRWTPALQVRGTIASKYVAARDVDRQEVLGLLESLLAPIGMVWWHTPHVRVVGAAPPDPDDWVPGMGHASVLRQPDEMAPGYVAGPTVPAWMIDGDPGPRLWMNLGPVVNEWTVNGPLADSGWNTIDGQWSGVAALPAAARRRYGEASAGHDTEIVSVAGVQGDHYQPWPGLASDWLARTGYPTWGCDGVIVVLDAETVRLGASTAGVVWRGLLDHGPGVCGMKVALEGVTGSASGDGTGWVCEGLTVEWVEGGWLISLDTLTDVAVYEGRATHPPIDPRNAVSLAAPVPATIGTGGVLLQPLLHRGGTAAKAGGFWRIVGGGAAGQAVPNRGIGTLVPSPALPVGGVDLEVQWHATDPGPWEEAGQPVPPAEWLRVPVTVAAGRTWDDAAAAWEDLPETATWDSSDEEVA